MADPNISDTDEARKPTRIQRALPAVYHWRRRLGDTMWESGFSATPVSDSECTRYVRADIANDLLEAAEAAVGAYKTGKGLAFSGALGLLEKAIAKAKGESDG